MRLADLVMRRGHLSEDAITKALLDGQRPVHLDQCDICSFRALELGRWLDEVRVTAVSATDEAFPAERLAAQQGQILRRLAQIDEPARVIAFPSATAKPAPEASGRRVAPAWVGVAAAAGLAVGVVGGQMAARLDPAAATTTRPESAEATAIAPRPVAEPTVTQPDAISLPAGFAEWELERMTPGPLQEIDANTPRLTTIAQRY